MVSRRLDPEDSGVIYWPQIWRSLRVVAKCKPVPAPSGYWMHDKIEWDVDTGYCLDRFSTLAELTEECDRRFHHKNK